MSLGSLKELLLNFFCSHLLISTTASAEDCVFSELHFLPRSADSAFRSRYLWRFCLPDEVRALFESWSFHLNTDSSTRATGLLPRKRCLVPKNEPEFSCCLAPVLQCYGLFELCLLPNAGCCLLQNVEEDGQNPRRLRQCSLGHSPGWICLSWTGNWSTCAHCWRRCRSWARNLWRDVVQPEGSNCPSFWRNAQGGQSDSSQRLRKRCPRWWWRRPERGQSRNPKERHDVRRECFTGMHARNTSITPWAWANQNTTQIDKTEKNVRAVRCSVQQMPSGFSDKSLQSLPNSKDCQCVRLSAFPMARETSVNSFPSPEKSWCHTNMIVSIEWLTLSCTTTAYRWLFRDLPSSWRILGSSVIKSSNFSVRSTAFPVRFLQGALVIFVLLHNFAISVFRQSAWKYCVFLRCHFSWRFRIWFTRSACGLCPVMTFVF